MISIKDIIKAYSFNEVYDLIIKICEAAKEEKEYNILRRKPERMRTQVISNYNISYNHQRHFSKNKKYNFRESPIERKIYIISDTGEEEEFLFEEFDTLFTLIEAAADD